MFPYFKDSEQTDFLNYGMSFLSIIIPYIYNSKKKYKL